MRFLLNDTLPKQIRVIDVTPDNYATKIFSIVADYDWAERILCTGCYMQDANDIANTIGNSLNIQVIEAT